MGNVRDPRAPTPLAYRPRDAAQVLGVSRSTIYSMIAQGRIAAYKIGAATVIRHDDLEALLASAAPIVVAAEAQKAADE